MGALELMVPQEPGVTIDFMYTGGQGWKGRSLGTALASVPKTAPYSSSCLCSHSLPGLAVPTLCPPPVPVPLPDQAQKSFSARQPSPCCLDDSGAPRVAVWAPTSIDTEALPGSSRGPSMAMPASASPQGQQGRRSETCTWDQGCLAGAEAWGSHRQKLIPTHAAPTKAAAAAAETTVVPWLP